MLITMASAHGGAGDDLAVPLEQQASDMDLVYQVVHPVIH
jgi:hypothetical protein